ncbi:SOSS complex subunit C-like [Mizuhopecten yessoensis]|uniref:SOSS complex subunit C n=1 Tax=Mizuhopecten yessoensis TaxID=6573 RepID=A0A210QAL6_MIZYE|nr:SOSS complex subunit C-like [Mizuhopecten yessoensis]OWF45769.1 SOSS complex subunit C [Mizuhopecten yessoensis]
MAFQPPGTGQEHKNRKILEQLEEQKKRLRMQTHGGSGGGGGGGGGASGGNGASSVANVGPGTTSTVTQQASHLSNISMVMETQHMTPAQRAALQHANANSVGYFITQDSSFGNLILPVLPRFNEKT